MKRHEAREVALKALFAYDLGKNDLDFVLKHLLEENNKVDENSKSFIEYLVQGVLEHKEKIDALIAQHSMEWKFERIAAVDRNIMRIALYEINYTPDMPAAVAINEAVELAKNYSSQESARFINGILGNFIKKSEEDK